MERKKNTPIIHLDNYIYPNKLKINITKATIQLIELQNKNNIRVYRQENTPV